tara:strand:- start:335 stop:724 length:390 start_codon:yes stop_codon:yes gene_type:complete
MTCHSKKKEVLDLYDNCWRELYSTSNKEKLKNIPDTPSCIVCGMRAGMLDKEGADLAAWLNQHGTAVPDFRGRNESTKEPLLERWYNWLKVEIPDYQKPNVNLDDFKSYSRGHNPAAVEHPVAGTVQRR